MQSEDGQASKTLSASTWLLASMHIMDDALQRVGQQVDHRSDKSDLCKLALAPNRAVDAAHVRERRGKCKPVEHLQGGWAIQRSTLPL